MRADFKCFQQDLLLDIRTGTAFDDRDEPYIPAQMRPFTWAEVSNANIEELTKKFLQVRNTAKAILEIGICRNGARSFTHCFLKNKKKETIYVGIDVEDKSFLNDFENNIYTIKNNSSNYNSNIALIKSFGVSQFDFIFIDGWHSINQCYHDWEYTYLLSNQGIVAFHDVSYHPGPWQFINAIDKSKWNVEENVCPDDFGLGFVWKK